MSDSTSSFAASASSTVPDKPTLDGIEAKWSAAWEEQGTFGFDRNKTRDQVYSIDTPPPTVSGSLHVGQVPTISVTRTSRARPMDGFSKANF